MMSSIRFFFCVVVAGMFTAICYAGPVEKYTESISSIDGGKVSFDMVLIDGGEFVMGSKSDEEGRNVDEGPVRSVKVDSFYLCSTETTHALFWAYYLETNSARSSHEATRKGSKVAAVTGATPIYGGPAKGVSKKNPAIGLRWHNAVTFCEWLSLKTGKNYRLPTEAEWEYAARAGGGSVYGFTDDAEKIGDYAWYLDNSDGEINPVASKKPNAWGLYDMAGNVREWVWDYYSETGYKEGAGRLLTNPNGPKVGKVHVARGGDYDSDPEELRCASRAFEEEWWSFGDPQMPKSKWWLPKLDIIGFRIACSVGDSTERFSKARFSATDKKGEYAFDTGILSGVLRSGGSSRGLSAVTYLPGNVRLDGMSGIFGYYRIFSKNRRYGNALWQRASEAKLLDDGAVEVRWSMEEGRPYEVRAVYRWKDLVTLDLETVVTPKTDLEDFEVFLASYFDSGFPATRIYVKDADSGEKRFMEATDEFGVWQMSPRDKGALSISKDGRWKIEPNPINWQVLPELAGALAVRGHAGSDLKCVVMACADDCFAISTPCKDEIHYSLYLSLIGKDIIKGRALKVNSRFFVAEGLSDEDVVEQYQSFLKEKCSRW